MFERASADTKAARAGPSSLEVALRCGVNSKTIRDIWNRETWVRATRALWTPEEEEAYHEAQRSKGELPQPPGEAAPSRGADDGDEAQVRPRAFPRARERCLSGVGGALAAARGAVS